jgi:hypothetical protein
MGFLRYGSFPRYFPFIDGVTGSVCWIPSLCYALLVSDFNNFSHGCSGVSALLPSTWVVPLCGKRNGHKSQKSSNVEAASVEVGLHFTEGVCSVYFLALRMVWERVGKWREIRMLPGLPLFFGVLVRVCVQDGGWGFLLFKVFKCMGNGIAKSKWAADVIRRVYKMDLLAAGTYSNGCDGVWEIVQGVNWDLRLDFFYAYSLGDI